MKASAWKHKIIAQCEAVGTYKDAFLPAIDALSKLLENRDNVYSEFLATGAQVMVEKISDRGAINSAVNPLLKLWQELNRDALAYWRDLGLTPAGLKRIDETAVRAPKVSALAEALKGVG